MRISTPEGVDVELTLAGIGSRFIAALFDFMIEFAIILAAGFLLGVVGGDGSGWANAGFAIIFFLVFFGYDVLFEVRARGRTPGKRWTGLRVVRTSGQPVTFVPSSIRNVMRLVDMLPAPPLYAVGMASIFVTGKNQRLGDLAGRHAGRARARGELHGARPPTARRPPAPPTAGTSARSRRRTSGRCASSSSGARASPTGRAASSPGTSNAACARAWRARPRACGPRSSSSGCRPRSRSLRPARGWERVALVRTAALGLMATLGLAACGEDSPTPEAASRPDAALVRSLPDPFDPGARQPPGTYVGKVGRKGWTYVGVVLRGDRALVYLCDGRASEWLGARVRDKRVLVRSARGTLVDAKVGEGVVRGSVRPRGQPAGAFSARAPGEGAGVFSGPDPAVPGRVRRWIVLEDGVRGVSDGTSNTIQVGESTATATRHAHTLERHDPRRHLEHDPARREHRHGHANQDGDAHTDSRHDPRRHLEHDSARREHRHGHANQDGDAHTDSRHDPRRHLQHHQLGESTATATPTRTATRTPTPGTIQDGTSNTIQLGETPVNGVAAGGAAPPPAPAVTTCPKDTRCPPPAPPKEERTGGSVSGGKLLPCPVLETLIKTLLAPAKTDPVARRQLVALTTQAKANGC